MDADRISDTQDVWNTCSLRGSTGIYVCLSCYYRDLSGPQDCNGELRAELLTLSKLLRHRGPDWNGITCFKNCYLAHERLAINGLLSGAQVRPTTVSGVQVLYPCIMMRLQPITNLSGDTALSVNGEIYNHRELRTQLEQLNPEVGITL